MTDPARSRADGTPADIDREIPALFMIFDEFPRGDNDEDPQFLSDQMSAEQRFRFQASEFLQKARLREQSARRTINGRAFGNLGGQDMLQGERVRWHLFALGSEDGLHTVHWHGARVIQMCGSLPVEEANGVATLCGSLRAASESRLK